MAEPAVSIRIDSERLQERFRQMPALVDRELRGALVDWGRDWERTMVLRMRGGAPGQSLADRLTTRTGALRGTFRSEVRGSTLRNMRLRLSSGGRHAPYARIHEYGGTIRPKRAKALTVPLRDALTPSGALSGKAVLRRKGGGGFTTDYGDTFLLKTGGKVFVAVKGRREGDLRLLYVLKRSVTIPGPKSTGSKSRLGARETASVQGPRGRYIRARVAEALQRIAHGPVPGGRG